MDLFRERGPEKTICPSEAARVYTESWRYLMPMVRDVVSELQELGMIEVLQQGEPVDVKQAKGPIRLRIVPNEEK